MADLVSILIPAYNAEKWIAETINSALQQTWPKKEIIIVDDGSTDKTLEIAKKYESTNIQVLSQENKGGGAARNRAFSYAQGNYIQWLDADDLLAPDKIEQQINKCEYNSNSQTLLTSSFGQFYFRHKKAIFTPNSLWQDLKPIDWLLIKLSENVWMNPATWLLSRRLAELAGPWDERLRRDQDGEYICRVVSVSDEVKFVRESRSLYRKSNVSSVSSSTSDKVYESLLLSLSLCMNYLRSLEDSERTRAACLVYLQTWLRGIPPGKHELIARMNELANEVGGNLTPPRMNWKYYLLREIVGEEAAIKYRNMFRSTKATMYINWDKFMYNLSKHD